MSPARYSKPCCPPISCDYGLFLSCAFRPLQSSILPFLPPYHTTVAFLGVSLSFAISVLGVYLPMGFPHPPMFRPQCFAHSRRFPPPYTLRICFVPLPRPRFLFRGFPQQPAGQAFARTYPPVVDAASDISPSGFCPITDPFYLHQFYPLPVSIPS